MLFKKERANNYQRKVWINLKLAIMIKKNLRLLNKINNNKNKLRKYQLQLRKVKQRKKRRLVKNKLKMKKLKERKRKRK